MNFLFTTILTSLLFLNVVCFAQFTEDANVYPTNLEENMYFEKYDNSTRKISGVNFLLLCDGTDSKKVTPSFTVKLYLMPEGKASKDDLIIVKTYEVKGLYHYGSMEYKNEVVDLSNISGLSTGNYRLGIWVNSEESFREEGSDNAALFQGAIAYNASASVNDNRNSNDSNSNSILNTFGNTEDNQSGESEDSSESKD